MLKIHIWKTFPIVMLLIWESNFVSAQMTLFKNINTQEASGNPFDFVELNGIVYFIATGSDGYRLWKTDGTEAGTTMVSNQNVYLSSINNKNLFVFGPHVYYQIINPNTSYVELWKTDGLLQTPLKFYSDLNFVSYQNELYHFQDNTLRKIVADSSISIKPIPNSLGIFLQRPVVVGSKLLFGTQNYFTNNFYTLQLWAGDGTTAGTNIFKQIDSTLYIPRDNNEKNFVKVGEYMYFFLYKKVSNSLSNYSCQLWKSDGTSEGTIFLKNIQTTNNTYELYYPKIIANNADKFIFSLNNNLWASDGTTVGTKVIANITATTSAIIYQNKFYLSANDGVNGFELWQSDGTPENTLLLKDINTAGSSSPAYFQVLNDKLYFLANGNNEVWQTDGTTQGTSFVQAVGKQPGDNNYQPASIVTADNQLIFKNYDAQTGYELWKSDLSLQNAALLKNLRTDEAGSQPTKILKIGSTWYFTAYDYRGIELWKTDGTPDGTTIVKDINAGPNGIQIQEYAEMGGHLYFTAYLTNTSNPNLRLFKSDGTAAGTIEILLNSNDTRFGVNPTSLKATSTKLFFKGYMNGLSTTLWVYDGTTATTILSPNTIAPFGTPTEMVVVKDMLYFSAGALWISDGTLLGTKRVLPILSGFTTGTPATMIEFSDKLYFLSSYSTYGSSGYGLLVTDGTLAGTKVLKNFGENLISTWLLFMKKAGNQFFFRGNYNSTQRSFDLWKSDGTTDGTNTVKTIFYGRNADLKGVSLSNSLIFQLTNIFGAMIPPMQLWVSDGTEIGTKLMTATQQPSRFDIDYAKVFNHKLYFPLSNPEFGNELWTTDGTPTGTYLVEEIRIGPNGSLDNTLMDFDDKLLLSATDGQKGIELWQYVPMPCEGNRNYTLQSGSWDNPIIWSCGRVPTPNDVVIIRSSHKVTVPTGYHATTKLFLTEVGAVLDIPLGAYIICKPN